MSLQAAQRFIDLANQDHAIRRLALERFSDIVTVGREHGYDFARDEFDQAMRERKAIHRPGPSGGRSDTEPTASNCQCPSGTTASNCQCPSGSTAGGTSRRNPKK